MNTDDSANIDEKCLEKESEINASPPTINPYGENTQKAAKEISVQPTRIQKRNFDFNYNKQATNSNQNKDKIIEKRRSNKKAAKKQKAKLRRK